jgi:DNA primase
VGVRGYDRQQIDSEIYTEEQIEAVLDSLEIEIVAETANDFLCFCPFHGNVNTPSFSVSRDHGSYICFNHACDANGTFRELVEELGQMDPFKAARFITKHRNSAGIDWESVAKKHRERAQRTEFPTFSAEKIERMHESFWNSPAHEYMSGRGYTDRTLADFQIGYSAKKNMVAIPYHDAKGNPLGVIGRGVWDKVFVNSKRLPTSRTLFNLHRAKQFGEVIICEASTDAMKIHQAGYPNVVATCMGHLSTTHLDMIEKYFSNVVIFTDNDNKQFYDNCRKCGRAGKNLCHGHNPGRELGHTIAEKLPFKRLFWAHYDEGIIYPRGVKDAGDMTTDEIKQCLSNRLSHYVYLQQGE